MEQSLRPKACKTNKLHPSHSKSNQYCHVDDNAMDCRLVLFQDADLARNLAGSKSTSGGVPCTFGTHAFVPISWMSNKQAAVSHTVVLSLELYRSVQVNVWKVSPRLIHGTLLFEVLHPSARINLPLTLHSKQRATTPNFFSNIRPHSTQRTTFLVHQQKNRIVPVYYEIISTQQVARQEGLQEHTLILV